MAEGLDAALVSEEAGFRMRALLAVVVLLATGAAAYAEPCPPNQPRRLRDGGKAFDAAGNEVPVCSGDLYAPSDILALYTEVKRLERALEAKTIALAELEVDLQDGALRAEDLQIEVKRLSAELEATRAAREAAEKAKRPDPPTRAPVYARWSTWVGAGIVVASIVTGVATKSNHPMLWAAGGAGAGMVLGGVVEF